jgi:hypothetical protein
MSYEARIARIEEALDRARDRDSGRAWAAPFFSRLREGAEANTWNALLADWEMSRRVAFVLHEAAKPDAARELVAYAEYLSTILWSAKRPPQHDDAIERLNDIRDRLRNVFSDIKTEAEIKVSH